MIYPAIERFAYIPNVCALGRLIVLQDQTPDLEWPTVERPWVNNRPFVSCIPVNTYPLRRAMHYSGDGVGGRPDYECFEICEVPGRSLIHVHYANYPWQVEGCVAPGSYWNEKYWGVAESKRAFTEFMNVMGDIKKTTIAIGNKYPTLEGILS